MRTLVVIVGLVSAHVVLAQGAHGTRERAAVIGPTQWSVGINDPPCALQVYIGRVNTTQDKASCLRLCADLSALPAGTSVVSMKLFSREERGDWSEGAVPWSGWYQVDTGHGCAVFKNWSNNRFREAKVVVTYEAR